MLAGMIEVGSLRLMSHWEFCKGFISSIITKKTMVKKAIIHRARYEFRNMLDQQFLPQAGIANQGSRFQLQEI